jgi:hypothetical protein
MDAYRGGVSTFKTVRTLAERLGCSVGKRVPQQHRDRRDEVTDPVEALRPVDRIGAAGRHSERMIDQRRLRRLVAFNDLDLPPQSRRQAVQACR